MSTAPHVLTPVSRAYAALRYAAGNAYCRAAYFAVIALIFVWPELRTANLLNDFPDAHYCQLYEEVARVTVAKFHELPLWDPYYCGGITAIGTPSARFISPTFVLTLLFGTLRGGVLTVLLMTFVGLEGAFRYVRARGGGALAAMTAAPIFAISGVFARSEVLGWTHFFGFELVPWALYGVRLACQGSRRGVAITAVAMGWIVGFGGTYTGPLTVIAATFEVLVMVAQRLRRPSRLLLIVQMGVLVALLSAALTAVRIWPVADTLISSPRIVGGTPQTSPDAIWDLLFATRRDVFKFSGYLIGLPVLPLVVLGIVRRRAIPLTLAGILTLWLAVGYGVRLSIFAVLRTIPPYTMLRAPERFLILFALVAAGLSAVGIRRLEAAARKRRVFVVLALVCHGLLLGDTFVLVQEAHAQLAARRVVPAPLASAGEFHQTRGNRWLAAYFPFMNRGSLTCFDDYDIPQSGDLRGDLAADEYLRDPAAGVVTRTAWSPTRIDLAAVLSKPARVYINQNWHPGWKASVGTVVEDNGLLAVDLPEGSHDVTVRFLPRSAVGGIGTSLLGLLVAVALVRRGRAREDTIVTTREWLGAVALCLAPFVAVVLTFAFMPEAKRAPPRLVTPRGEPMIVDALPPESVPVGARWDGITLEAAHVELVPRSDGHGTNATLELDWKIDKKLPPGLGIFVRFERPAGTHVGADHVRLSDVLLLENAPLHVTIRDFAETVTLPANAAPLTWTVRVGVWWALRDEKRLEVLAPGPGATSDRAAFVTTATVP